jgi:hypothetical protein
MKAIQETRVHVEEIDTTITLDHVQTDACRIKDHSYETIDYIPDFEGQRYKLLIQCTDWGLETFEKINNDKAVCGKVQRYWKKADEVSNLVMKQAFATEGRV